MSRSAFSADSVDRHDRKRASAVGVVAAVVLATLAIACSRAQTGDGAAAPRGDAGSVGSTSTASAGSGGQVADAGFSIALPKPRFEAGAGPVVCVDAAHENFHTIDTRYAPFAAVLRADGFRVESLREAASARSLAGCKVLVIANAVPPANAAGVRSGSPFRAEEIDAIEVWVKGGGGLWLIADHQPFPMAAAPLAARFGFTLQNGFALKSGATPPDLFRREDGTLQPHPLLRGPYDGQSIDTIATFTGSAFQLPSGAQSLLQFPEGYYLLFPDRPWEFDASTRHEAIGGWSQGATLEIASGRVVVFGEAALFTSQTVDGGDPVGLLHPLAQGNVNLLRRLAAWLAQI